MNNYFLKRGILFLCLILILACFCQRANAHPEEEISLLRMYYKEEELVVTPSRNPKPLSQTAENITIITLDEIEAMNAHTLTDVLKNIPGVQMDSRGGPGSTGDLHIQGSEFNHVLLMIDGIAMNNLASGFADIGAFPVQNIGRIEIIKGPASSSWGSSLGGVINVITKPAGIMEKPSGSIFQSGGEKKTLDSRIELSDKAGNLGYYLSAGNLFSDGLRPTNSFEGKNLYTKLRWDLADSTNLIFSLGYNEGAREEGQRPSWKYPGDYEVGSNDFEYLFSTLRLNYFLNSKFDLTLSFRTSKQEVIKFINLLSTGLELGKDTYDVSIYGGTFLLKGKYRYHNIVLGADFEHGKLKSNAIVDKKQEREEKAVFINDTIIINKVSFIPGIRYDHISIHDKFLSPSLGISYRASEKTVLRGYMAKGFNTIPLSYIYIDDPDHFVVNTDLKVEKVFSVQAGIESTSLKYIWLKSSFFKHNIKDALDHAPWPEDPSKITAVNQKKQRRQGFEIEIKTAPLFNTSLLAGFVLIDVKNMDTGERLPDVPRHTYDIGIQHVNKKSFQASLKGHYVRWDYPTGAQKTNFIWDLYLMKKIHQSGHKALKLFLSGHNIFDGQQYLWEEYKNPGRWIEAGLRCNY